MQGMEISPHTVGLRQNQSPHPDNRQSRSQSDIKKSPLSEKSGDERCSSKKTYCFFMACSTATATSTEAPTIGLLPMPMSPIISTWAGTEEDPAN